MAKLTLKSLDDKINKLTKQVENLAKSFSAGGVSFPANVIDLSQFTEIGKEVDLGEGIGTVRLVDMNYEGTGMKAWEFVNVTDEEVSMGYPDEGNVGGYPTAKNIHSLLDKIYEAMPSWLKDQIEEVEVPCYIPKDDKEIKVSAKLFLPSITELCQNRPEQPHEGRPLEYFIKNTPSFNNWQWLRTPYRSNSNYAWLLNNNGDVDYSYAYYAFGVAPLFVTK